MKTPKSIMDSIRTRAYFYNVNGTCTDQKDTWLLAEAVQRYLESHSGLISIVTPRPCKNCKAVAIYCAHDIYLCDRCLIKEDTPLRNTYESGTDEEEAKHKSLLKRFKHNM